MDGLVGEWIVDVAYAFRKCLANRAASKNSKCFSPQHSQFDLRKPGKVTLVQRLSLIVASAESCFISGGRPLPTPTTFVLL